MKNIFDSREWETKLLEKELDLETKEREFNARWVAKELENKNEIIGLEIRHKKELADKDLVHSEYVSDLNCVHKERLAELREEMKTELGAKAIELEKQVAVLEKELSLKNTHIFELINDKRNLEKELQLMTNVALEASAKSAEVRIHDTKVVSPQVIEGKINVISTCGK